jgi:hypothetical protein
LSDRFLYRKIPAVKRRCTGCQEPILRNIFRGKDGRLWHYGCWNTARDQHYECLDCNAKFDATEACFVESQSCRGDEVQPTQRPVCPFCGSFNLKNPVMGVPA